MNAVIRRRMKLRLGFLLFDTQLILGNDSIKRELDCLSGRIGMTGGKSLIHTQ